MCQTKEMIEIYKSTKMNNQPSYKIDKNSKYWDHLFDYIQMKLYSNLTMHAFFMSWLLEILMTLQLIEMAPLQTLVELQNRKYYNPSTIFTLPKVCLSSILLLHDVILYLQHSH